MKRVSIWNSFDIKAKEEVIINFCKDLAKLSKCQHGKVAAILVGTDFRRIFSMGVNGGPADIQSVDCCCNELNAKYGCAHAEQNCLVKNTDQDYPKILICTKACCPTCASLIVNADVNITEFWYIDEFSDTLGLKILSDADITVFRIIE